MANLEAVAEEEKASSQEDLVSDLASKAKAVFEGSNDANTESLQNLLDCLTVKVVAVAFEMFREEFDNLVRLLRNAYGQVARFVEGDFREHPSFYLGQLHALTEITYRSGHQRVPREALESVARSQVAANILTRTAQEKSIGAGDLARELGMEESNLSTICKPLVKQELLRRNRFGKRIRYSPTPLTSAVIAALGGARSERNAHDEQEPVVSRPTSASPTTPDRRDIVFAATGDQVQGRSNVGGNADDFVSSLLNLAALRGAKGIAIEPSGRRVRLEGAAKRSRSEVSMPLSVGKSLSEQMRACSQLRNGIVDWNGQKIVVAGGPDDTSVKVAFVDLPDPQTSKAKVRVGFQKIQEEKERLERVKDWEKICVREALEGCKWKSSEAAAVLGIEAPKLTSLMKDLNITQNVSV